MTHVRVDFEWTVRAILYRISFGTKEYYGITKETRFEKRMSIHRRAPTNTVLGRSIRKQGWEYFKVEKLVIGSLPYIKELEIQAIKTFNSKAPNGYNITSGGEHWDPSGKNHWAYGCKGEKHPAYGNKLSKEAKEKIAEYQTGKIRSVETRRKMSEAKRGNNFGTCRKNPSLAMRKSLGTDKERYKLSDGRVFNSASECARAIGAFPSNVRKSALDGRYSVHGYKVVLIKE